MNNGVKQAGTLNALSPAPARHKHKEDAAQKVFGDILQAGKNASPQMDDKSAESVENGRWKGISPRLDLAVNAIGLTWDTDTRTNVGSDPDGKNSEEPLVLDNENAEPSEAGLPLAPLAFFDNVKLRAGAKDDETGTTVAAPVQNLDDRANPSLGKATLGPGLGVPDGPADMDGQGTPADAERTAYGEKSDVRPVANKPPIPVQSAPSDAEPQHQNSNMRPERAPPESARSAADETTRETRQNEPAGTNSKVSVLETQSLPAPVASAATATTSAFIEAISADQIWKTSAPETAALIAQHARAQPGALQSLKIQLHPAELGMVTANLRFAGEQLSVELKVESAEAYHRLSNDTDIMIKAFRALGYEVDQIAIQQPQPNTQLARTDIGTANSTGFSRDLQSGFSSDSGSSGERLAGRGADQGGGNDARYSDSGSPVSHERPSRGLYI